MHGKKHKNHLSNYVCFPCSSGLKAKGSLASMTLWKGGFDHRAMANFKPSQIKYNSFVSVQVTSTIDSVLLLRALPALGFDLVEWILVHKT